MLLIWGLNFEQQRSIRHEHCISHIFLHLAFLTTLWYGWYYPHLSNNKTAEKRDFIQLVSDRTNIWTLVFLKPKPLLYNISLPLSLKKRILIISSQYYVLTTCSSKINWCKSMVEQFLKIQMLRPHFQNFIFFNKYGRNWEFRIF